MVQIARLRRALFGRDIAVAYAVMVALYLLRVVGIQPLQLPAYLLIVAYDVLELAVPALAPYYAVGFPLFLYLLAVVAAGVTRWLRSGDTEQPTLGRTVGGVSLVVGSLALLFGGVVGGPLLSATDNPTPLAITGVTAAVCLGGGLVLLDRTWIRFRRPG